MPELPEVETIRRQLAPLVEGRKLANVQVLDPRWSRPLVPIELERALTGRRIERLARRGKYLVWDLGGDLHLVQHLRMTGSVLYEPDPEPAHMRVRIELGPAPGQRRARRRARIAITDPRRFGTGELVEGAEALEEFFEQRLGLEPFDERFTTEHLGALMRGRTAPVKALLLDQRKIAGVGNIYADEALFRARIHPLRRAGSLSREQRERLRAGIVEALAEGIDARGASIDDFRHIDGFRGSFQDRFLVHLRAGEPCVRCGSPIVKIVAAGRGTYVCENCQRPPRRRRAKST
ncbi:MAG TPA: bifunctional DNA-formamidopyrimidine glycosylase/DNA-(apurinic or apyrimidinic site) lyase [Solirubrobacteraceae bacterium]|nr:bifunctional DNA-formamidopyrimidine glycosylase/DNA-(apurinic or apyrimidinic site) lyase [Solirubrobacteraceae bacterium]